MSRDPRQLTFTCDGDDRHRLVEVGPDPEKGGAITGRWKRKEKGGNRLQHVPWPHAGPYVDDDWGGGGVAVRCRCWRGMVSMERAGEWYDRGLRGQHSIQLLRRPLPGQ